MTSKPDQSPATELAGIPATDPVEKASAAESEQDLAPDDVVGDSATDGAAAVPEQADDAPDTEGPASAAIEPVPSADEPVDDEPVADEPVDNGSVSDDSVSGGEQGTAAASDGKDAADEGGDVKSDGVEEVSEAETTGTVEATDHVAAAEKVETAGKVKAADKVKASKAEQPTVGKPADAASTGDPDVAVAVDSAPDEVTVDEASPDEVTADDAGSDLPRRSERYEAPTEEISIVPPPARQQPTTSAPDLTPATDAAAPAAAAKPEEPEEPTEAEADDADSDVKPASAKPAADEPTPRATSKSAPAPVVDENFDFKALSFAAISAAHKRELGPRTVAGDPETAEEPKADSEISAEDSAAEAPAATETSAEGTPTDDGATEEPAAEKRAVEEPDVDADPELFAPPATHIPPVSAPPSPFPTPSAPAHHQPGAQAQPSVPVVPPSPFPTSRGGSGHSFPAVNDYAPEASYAGWRPPTAADETAKRRRYALIGGAALAVVAVIAVIAVVVNMVSKQQWEPIEAMIAEPQEVHTLQLVLGSCVQSIPEDGEVSEVLAVPCDASHTAQVVGRTDFADAAIWPGRDAVDKRVAQVCGTKQLGPTARTGPVAGLVSYVVWGPSEASWGDGDRVGLCLATTAEPITQDLLQ